MQLLSWKCSSLLILGRRDREGFGDDRRFEAGKFIITILCRTRHDRQWPVSIHRVLGRVSGAAGATVPGAEDRVRRRDHLRGSSSARLFGCIFQRDFPLGNIHFSTDEERRSGKHPFEV